jgi:hypothetical protein
VYKSLLLGIGLLRDGCTEAQVNRVFRSDSVLIPNLSQTVVHGLLQGKDGAPFMRAIRYRLLRALEEVKEAKRALKQRRYALLQALAHDREGAQQSHSRWQNGCSQS